MSAPNQYEFLHAEGSDTPIKGWVRGVPLERQARAAAAEHRLAAVRRPVGRGDARRAPGHRRDRRLGGADRGAIIPAAVGVDIGCGMAAVRTTLTRQRPARQPRASCATRSSAACRSATGPGGEHRAAARRRRRPAGAVGTGRAARGDPRQASARSAPDKVDKQLGTLGGGNHFIEICLDEDDRVWVMLHSGSRGIGNLIGTLLHRAGARGTGERMLGFHLPDKDLAFFLRGRAAVRRLRGGGVVGAGLRARQPRGDDGAGAARDAPAPAEVPAREGRR